ncbi:MAG: glutamine-hydrolyzing GMP synthase [Candidatus Bathyarchaeota archaeon]|jgi:GMP synthase (glutamine-hydrolysing)|nr:glutamine-hydrolyzing GMP synthase [Candidatus Bathyarchaeota archaeon]MDI9577234.1 glutamine-hydrolyzing GMP synthase [Thermoproteota archaeon]MDT8782361.1 glutamine-hydrolyzing GMP synthase [Candidatus Bathyarchaeota archaeon]NLD65333.1 glutamine-hydrolyzing GMP synthase [Thermoproteota archaeon]
MFDAKTFIENSLVEIKTAVGNSKVISACSGGVDSTVATYLVHKAVGDQLVAVFVDDGLRREGEPEFVVRILKELKIKTRYINAKEDFFKTFKGKTDAEEKRKAFRDKFYTTLGKVAKEEQIQFITQGTIKADVLETVKGIKSQHNVLEQIGINPEIYGYKILEPLRELFKPEVRMVGRELGLPSEISERMPFPGPALSLRILGEVTQEKAVIVRKATEIVEQETTGIGAFQSFAVLHNDKATGIKNGNRLYGNIITVRIVNSSDAVTAFAVKVPYDLLERISKRITTEIPTVVRCLYDITDKPPSTIEFE